MKHIIPALFLLTLPAHAIDVPEACTTYAGLREPKASDIELCEKLATIYNVQTVVLGYSEMHMVVLKDFGKDEYNRFRNEACEIPGVTILMVSSLNNLYKANRVSQAYHSAEYTIKCHN